MKRKVLRLSRSFSQIKEVNLMLPTNTSKELFEDPLKSVDCPQRWKIRSAYGDIGLKYRDDETLAYVASRMPAVYSALYRVLSEVRRRLPGFSPSKVLDFGAGTGSAFCRFCCRSSILDDSKETGISKWRFSKKYIQMLFMEAVTITNGSQRALTFEGHMTTRR